MVTEKVDSYISSILLQIKFISEISKSNFFYFSHFKFVSHLGNYIQNGLYLYPIWALDPNLSNDFLLDLPLVCGD